jgi:tetratricopeptide (TPR) repeat protein
MSVKKTQVLLLSGALILAVLLFMAPKSTSKVEKEEVQQATSSVDANADISIYLRMANKALEPSQNKTAERYTAAKQFDSLVLMWDNLKRPDLASYFAEERAKSQNTFEEWLKAGTRYYYAVQFCQDKSETPLLYQSAIRCFIKSLALQPDHNDARIKLASCYVEGTSDPMKGISLLKEVEKVDSNNLQLQLAFAFFSVKSGQMDKAIVRFKKALAADSTYIEAYLHLADAYEQTDKRAECITMLEKYAKSTPDITVRLEVNKYIQELKTEL